MLAVCLQTSCPAQSIARINLWGSTSTLHPHPGLQLKPATTNYLFVQLLYRAQVNKWLHIMVAPIGGCLEAVARQVMPFAGKTSGSTACATTELPLCFFCLVAF